MTLPRALVAAVLLAGPVAAGPGVPGPDWFAGVYERIGRDGAESALDDRVQIAPAGDGLRLIACGAPDMAIGFDPYGLRENALVSGTGSTALACLFHNDGYNRPVITCRSGTGLRFTLWPVEPGFRTDALVCGG